MTKRESDLFEGFLGMLFFIVIVLVFTGHFAWWAIIIAGVFLAWIDKFFKDVRKDSFAQEKKSVSKIGLNDSNKLALIKKTLEIMLESTALQDTINVQIQEDKREIVLNLKNGLNDPNFRDAFPVLILRKSFLENCKSFGVKRIVFIDLKNNTFDDIVINNLDLSQFD